MKQFEQVLKITISRFVPLIREQMIILTLPTGEDFKMVNTMGQNKKNQY